MRDLKFQSFKKGLYLTGTNDWDYCCRAGSDCGYSGDYDFSWCYVGETGYDQWRPCEIME